MAAACALLVSAALLYKQSQLEEIVRSNYDIENLPQLLVESLTNPVDENIYRELTQGYNRERLRAAEAYLLEVPRGSLGHCDINCITSKTAFSSLCGYTYAEFLIF